MSTKYFSKAALLFTFIIVGSLTINAQENDSLLQQRIRYQQYVFVPLSATSGSGTTQILSKDFKVAVTIDSVISVLPYYGRSYTPQFGRANQDEAIVFTSTNFEYSAVPKKKGKWEISIKPKDARGVRLSLTVFDNGDATMDITMPGKETMLYKGYVW